MQSIDSWVLDSVSDIDIDTAYIIVITDIYSGVFWYIPDFFVSKFIYDEMQLVHVYLRLWYLKLLGPEH